MESIELSPVEKMALSGYAAKEQLINAEYQQFMRLLESAHGLETGAIGTTHLIDIGAGKLTPKNVDTP